MPGEGTRICSHLGHYSISHARTIRGGVSQVQRGVNITPKVHETIQNETRNSEKG